MSVVLLFVLLMIIAVMIKLAVGYFGKSYSGGSDSSDDSGDDGDDNDDSSPELDLIDADEMPGHTDGGIAGGVAGGIAGGGAADSSTNMSQNQLRELFESLPPATAR